MASSSRTLIVCLAEHEWSPLPSREQHLMERLARHVDVVYVNPMLQTREWAFPERTIEISPSLWVHEPKPLPGARRFGFAKWMTSAWLARHLASWQREGGTCVLWLCSPKGVPFIEMLRPDRVVYDMADLQATPRGHRLRDEDERRDIQELANLERTLLEQADVTFCASASLVEFAGSRDGRVHLLPNGCEPSRHRTATAMTPSPGQTRVGYLGALDPHVDAELIASLEKSHPDWTVEVATDIAVEDVAAKLASWDVCLLPFREIDFAYHSSPVQAYDYLAAGKPIVSTPIAQIEEWTDLVTIARGAQGFASAIEAIVKAPSSALVTTRRIQAARNSWEVRIAQVADALAGIDIALGQTPGTVSASESRSLNKGNVSTESAGYPIAVSASYMRA